MDEWPERRTALGGEEAPDLAQHAQEHSWREAAGLSVLLARVIGGKQAGQPRWGLLRGRGFGVSRMGCRRLSGESARQLIARAVRKFISGASGDRPALQQEFQVGIKGDASQRQDRARAYQIEFRFQIRQAVASLSRQRLVVGGGATRPCAGVSAGEGPNGGALPLRSVIRPAAPWRSGCSANVGA